MLNNSAGYGLKLAPKKTPYGWAKNAGSSTGAAGKVAPGVPRVVSGVAAKTIHSAMQFAPPSMSLVDRIRAARGDSRGALKQALASGQVVAVKTDKRPIKLTAKAFW